MTKKVAFYARAAGKTGEGSIEAQIKRGKAFAAERAWTVVKVFSDVENDEVVFKARPGIEALCACIEGGTIDIVLCDAPVNVSSERLHIIRFLAELRSREIELWSVTSGEALSRRNIPDTGSEADADQQNDRTEAVDRARTNGRGVRPAGYGYKLTSTVTAGGQRIFGYRVINPEEAEVIRRIFRMYAAGRSPLQIADALNVEGVKGPAGKPWREVAIRGSQTMGTGILHNATYAGKRQRGDGSFDGYVSALRIVSDELWQRVQDRHASSLGRRFRP